MARVTAPPQAGPEELQPRCKTLPVSFVSVFAEFSRLSHSHAVSSGFLVPH